MSVWTNDATPKESPYSNSQRGILIAVEPPAPDYTVPPRLRAAYDDAPELLDRDLIGPATKALHLRADRVKAASLAAYRRKHGAEFMDVEDSVRRRVISGGLSREDFEHGQHLQRLEVAEQKVSAAEQAAEIEAKRQAARCRSCAAIDVPTRNPVVALTVDAPNVAYAPASAGTTVTLDGGPVCAPCEATIVAQYVANLADEPVGKRRTRADAARDYRASLPKSRK